MHNTYKALTGAENNTFYLGGITTTDSQCKVSDVLLECEQFNKCNKNDNLCMTGKNKSVM